MEQRRSRDMDAGCGVLQRAVLGSQHGWDVVVSRTTVADAILGDAGLASHRASVWGCFWPEGGAPLF